MKRFTESVHSTVKGNTQGNLVKTAGANLAVKTVIMISSIYKCISKSNGCSNCKHKISSKKEKK